MRTSSVSGQSAFISGVKTAAVILLIIPLRTPGSVAPPDSPLFPVIVSGMLAGFICGAMTYGIDYWRGRNTKFKFFYMLGGILTLGASSIMLDPTMNSVAAYMPVIATFCGFHQYLVRRWKRAGCPELKD